MPATRSSTVNGVGYVSALKILTIDSAWAQVWSGAATTIALSRLPQQLVLGCLGWNKPPCLLRQVLEFYRRVHITCENCFPREHGTRRSVSGRRKHVRRWRAGEVLLHSHLLRPVDRQTRRLLALRHLPMFEGLLFTYWSVWFESLQDVRFKTIQYVRPSSMPEGLIRCS
ncbi:uncharacterized protein HMPREF1120_07807 [Exophiala dermatitidis NIH/UT8656]|uniref:Uncharacterized protein n=1 Tax=Exophiala dermatitidis (strain ATCC 34100 / CBS 525.76 / NIH/UT8656) TaxID=858893 RepID=H6C5G9_EXODN|nr:uncharacterized protein HMPREF1120_07807 [Exophiala dermatitidis NIH/UT8656]EHY59827.1 hypothetical protein HMPREF1120_07807 [Exophiala dermatitidis NIH/UT8656]